MPTEAGPLWRADLRAVGYVRPPNPEVGGVRGSFGSLISFPYNNVLLATYVTRERVGTLASRDRPEENLPLRLHGIFLDTATKKVKATREWPSSTLETGVAATRDGKFLVRAGDRISLYSPSLELIRTLAVPRTRRPVGEWWDGYISPTGKSVLVEHSIYGDEQYNWIDSDSFETRRSWSDQLPGVIRSISDDVLAVDGTGEHWEDGFLIRKLELGSWRVLCHRCSHLQFVNDQMLVLGLSNRWALLQTNGEVLFSQEYHDEGPAAVRAAANGTRFAVAIEASRGGSALLDISPHAVLKRVMVYDIPSRQWVYSVSAKQLKIKRIPVTRYGMELFDLALSPDGSLLGILSDGVVQVYRLPDPATQRPAPQ